MSSNENKFKVNYLQANEMDLGLLKDQFEPDEDDINFNYNPFDVNTLQNYQPIFKNFFKMDDDNYNLITFNQKNKIIDLQSVYNNKTNENIPCNIFIKNSPLLDPIKYMIGKYDINDEKIRTLPKLMSTEEECHNKLLSQNNSSYVDCFFSFLSSNVLHHYNFKNSIDFYGSFLAVQKKFKMNITDDYDYLNESDYFLENINNHFDITKYELLKQFMDNHSRKNKNKLNISESILTDKIDDDIIESLEIEDIEKVEELEEIYTNENDGNSSDDSKEILDDEDEEENDEEDSEEDSEEESEEESEEDSEPEISIQAYIKNFPVQMICLEKCDGTIDDLFEAEEVDDANGSAYLLQIIMTLITYQKAFHFTHNDLHTNNIMYKNTEIEFLYYKYNNKYYKVPTYGKIFKIIDFGRSIYKFKGRTYCSDSFAPGGDAATQYNCEPYYNDNKPVIEPNYSFDLCRLGCSIYDFIIDDEEYEDMNELQKIINKWCTDDNNANILYKKNGSERYPEFKLYKMIARTVHKHTPQKQLDYLFFNQYKENIDNPENLEIMDIDTIDCYV